MPTFGPVVPVLRIFDPQKANEFYIAYLGCRAEFEHRFGDNFPLYMGVTLGDCRLHLTEHHGDACPGAAIRIAVVGIDDFVHALQAKDYRFAKPGDPEDQPWGSREVTLTDPFGNRLTFFESH